MSKDKIKLAIISTGIRPKQIFKNLLAIANDVEVVAVFDPDKDAAREALKEWNQPNARITDTSDEAITMPEVDWVMVFSPNACHHDHITTAFAADKHVFSEKPMVTTIADCVSVQEAHQASGKQFATGFVLRYAPIYRKAHELINAGAIGQILSIDANENLSPRHGSYIMCNWRRYSSLAGPHILEKCCHDLDLLNWLIDSLPSKIASFGGRDFFNQENRDHYKQFIDVDGAPVFKSVWEKPKDGDCPFAAEKDIYDNQVAILEYRNNVRVMFQATLSNALPERRMYFSGTEGTMVLELFSGILKVKRIDKENTNVYNFATAEGHAGGDKVIMRELYDTMKHGTEPKCSGDEGLESTVVALSIHEAAEQGKLIDLEPVWQQLNR